MQPGEKRRRKRKRSRIAKEGKQPMGKGGERENMKHSTKDEEEVFDQREKKE
jgi:hypothetical protein